MMERSVSLCRLNLRDSDSDHRRNGAQGSRVKERSSRFQRDCGQAPPKILISSASQDGGRGPRPVRPATSRSWSTEDFRTEASLEEGGVRTKPHLEEGGVRSEPSPEEGGVRSEPSLEEGGVRSKPSLEKGGSRDSVEAAPEVSQTWNSSPLTDVHSPTGSWVPESITADSAISSPDCWLDSDFGAAPEKLSESRSDGSLCDSGTAWEVYRAVPVQITTLHEGLVPSLAGGLPDEQWCADEGIYSLSSLESTQEQGPSLTYEPMELNTSNHSQDVPLDQASDGGSFQTEDVSEQEDLRQVSDEANVSADLSNQPIMSLRASLPPPEEKISEAAGGSKEAVEQGGDVQDHHHETATPTQNQAEDGDTGDEDAKGQEEDAPSEETAEAETNKMEQWMMMMENGTSEGLLRECQEPQDGADQVHTSEDLLAPNTRAAVPLITISTEEEQGGEGEGEPEGPDPAGLVESEAAVSSDRNSDPGSCGALEEPGQEPVDENDLPMLPTAPTTLQTHEREVRGGCEPSLIHSPDSVGTSLTLGTQQGSEVTGEDRLEDRSGPPAAAGRFPQMDLLPAAVDENSPTEELVGHPLEPMDLFYPDKDEAIFSEPPEAQAEAWPSVLSVSALQPAPASGLFEEGAAELLGHHVVTRDSQVGVFLLLIVHLQATVRLDVLDRLELHI